MLRHLARQTTLPLALVDLLDLRPAGARAPCRGAADRRHRRHRRGRRETLAAAGDLLWQAQGFVLGSQGVEYALVAAWRRAGLLPSAPHPCPSPAGRVAVVSGSCSPTTAAQIDVAETAGFVVIDLDARAPDWDAAFRAARAALADGRSPLVASARGRNDAGADPEPRRRARPPP